MDLFLYALDLVGTFAFAISGATVGVRYRLDIFGVLVLSFAAAVSGGIFRDLLIGATPPAALVGWHYLGISCLAGIITFFRYESIEKLRNP
ncbi:MAG: TRIC cation channel family protein, partial [Dokdonella sp.]